MIDAGLVQYNAHSVATIMSTWRDSPGPAHSGLAASLRLAILDGRLPLEAELPSERSLAQALGVSRTTVTSAYVDLASHGFLDTQPRRRARVRLPRTALHGLSGPPPSDLVDLTSASPAGPGEPIHQAYTSALDYLPRYLSHTGYERVGIPELRDAIADWFSRRGLATRPEHILVTHGAQHALSLIARTLLPARARVVVEQPTYPNALALFQELHAKLIPAPLVTDRHDLTQMSAAIKGAHMAYLVPDFHNPTGHVLPLWAREQLRPTCHLVIDETMVELGLDGNPLSPEPPMATFHADAFTLGSISKSVWGGLRVGWVRARRSAIDRLAQSRPASDLGNSLLDQLAAAELISSGATSRAADSLARTARCDHLRDVLMDRIPGVAIARPQGGLALWVQLPQPVAAQLAAAGPNYGLVLSAGPRFSATGAFRRHLRIPYTLAIPELDDAVRRLASLLDAVKQGEHGTHQPAPLN